MSDTGPPPEPDPRTLSRLLAGPDVAWLVDRVRARSLAAGGQPLAGVVVLRDPSPEQRAAAVRLIGRSPRSGADLRVDLGAVEAVLRRGPWPAGLAHAVETLTGPVIDPAAARAAAAAAWVRAESGLREEAERWPGLGAWWAAHCAGGGLKRAARAEAARSGPGAPGAGRPEVAAGLVAGLAAVLARLPSAGEPLAVLAQRAVGDAHALDESRPLGRLAAAALAAAYAVPGGDLSPRDAWAAAGVVKSTVASRVLALGLPGAADPGALGPLGSATASALEAMRGARSPVLLTLDQVRSGGVALAPAGSVVYVCENPSVVEVAAAHWALAATDVTPRLVCTSGQPSTAVVELLGALGAGGATLRYHGDFDWAGLRIAQATATRWPWLPWRFGSGDYLAAVEASGTGVRLGGRPAASPWDPALAAAMQERGLAVEEEAVAHLLAGDLLGG